MNLQRTRSAATRYALAGVAMVVAASAVPTLGNTVAYWRFEDGVAGEDVNHIAVDANTYSADILDVSGNGNHLSTWVTGGCCGYGYRDDVATGTIAATGAVNNLSVQNTDGAPGMFTGPTGIGSITPAQFTVETSFRLENGGYRTIIGRDSTDVATTNRELAAFYLIAQPGNNLAVKFADQEGFFHEAVSQDGIINTFAFPNTAEGDWYHAAGVSDGATLSLYLANATQGTGYQLIAQTDLTASGSTNTAMATPNGSGGDWTAGNWTVGRGMYNGGHGDRAWGYLDEVRISDSALGVNDLLHFGSGQNLSIDVNAATGQVTLRNTSTNSVTLDYYEITSDSGSLSKSGWSSLADQGVEVHPPGDYNADGQVDAADYTVYRDGLGTTFAPADYDVWAENYGADAGAGYGWTEAGGSDASILSELLLDAAGTTLAPGASISLGAGFNTGVGAQDLSFSYGRPGSGLFVGGVNYVGAATTVPEPASLAALACGALVLLRRRVA
ncbi:hypothetical protein Pla108_19990 [Botrimarina colliarenosi]|uniref:PEP-CTERM protein-sorting domain-containing protein n=1 Tax=Botrimarina colliarenosi TaxID=2528001 RepID=A0A5C6AEJ5_9BACT|nr:LamG domain-containing protein [Botrimarina colliarenosi]TWT97846.1 hypothetical protein Pla108_19990 [Botrimarina colliarenosi]